MPNTTPASAVRKLRRSYAQARRDASLARTRYDVSDANSADAEARAIARSIAAALGHLALAQRDAFECAKCGASGTASATLTGAVFSSSCEVRS